MYVCNMYVICFSVTSSVRNYILISVIILQLLISVRLHYSISFFTDSLFKAFHDYIPSILKVLQDVFMFQEVKLFT